MEDVLGEFSVPLDGLCSSLRTSETNLGNFICDVMVTYQIVSCYVYISILSLFNGGQVAVTDSDLALLNSGTLRSDRIHPPGPFKIRDLSQILPMLDPLIVVEISGEDLLAALENGVCMYPKLDARFLQVGGMSFAFDPKKLPFQRVDSQFVRIGNRYLDIHSKYRMVTKAYMMAGKHGFDVLKKLKILVNQEDNMPLTTAVQNHLQKLRAKNKRPGHHGQNQMPFTSSLKRMIDHESHPESTFCDSVQEDATAEMVHLTTKQGATKLLRQSSIEDIEKVCCQLEPRIEGRIVIINEETFPQLLSERQLWEIRAVHTIRESNGN